MFDNKDPAIRTYMIEHPRTFEQVFSNLNSKF